VQDYAKALLPAMHRIAPEADIQFEARADAPGCNAEEEAELTKLVQALAREDRTAKVAYATEAGLFQGIGLPSIVCGPGSIEQAHKPNEFCELAQIARCERFLEALTTRLSA
jgi:acetylornithine deacetylase